MKNIQEIAFDFLNTHKSKVTDETYSKTKHILEDVILPNIDCKKSINEINELDCKKFNEFVSTLEYSTSHKNVILNKYKILFKHAIKFYGLKHNPSVVIEPFQETFEEKMKHREKEMCIWSEDEFFQFIEYVQSFKYKVLFTILYFSGLRIGELIALQWKDFYNDTLHFYKSIPKVRKNGIYEIKEPKNISSIRDVPLGMNLSQYLQTYKEHEQNIVGFNEEWFIFGRIKPIARSTITRNKDESILLSNVKRITIHEFRHSHASNLIANGINIVAVSRRLGHSDVNMTLKIYTHLLKKTEKQLVTFLDKSSQNLLKQ